MPNRRALAQSKKRHWTLAPLCPVLLAALMLFANNAGGATQAQDRPETVTGRIQKVLSGGRTIKVNNNPYQISKDTRIGYLGAKPYQLPPSRLKRGMVVRFQVRHGAQKPLQQVVIMPR